MKTGDELFTQRLHLRKLGQDDLDNYHAIFGQEQVSRWLGSGKSIDHATAQKILENFGRHWDKYGYGVYGVFRKEDGMLIGQCGLNKLQDTDDIELLYAIDPGSWGNGYATESAAGVVSFARKQLNLPGLAALAYPENNGSSRVLDKLGFRYVEMQRHFGAELGYYRLEFDKN